VTPEQLKLAGKVHGFKRLRSSAADIPNTRITFLRLRSPDAMVTEDGATFKKLAKNSMQASLARPSTGGAVKDSLSASPRSPVMAFVFARGWTLTTKEAERRTKNKFFSLVSVFLCVLCGQDLVLSPKMAVPMRTQLDPSSMATSKSCDMPIESTCMLRLGSFRAWISSRNLRSLRK